jgi:hypothetical protein
LVARFLGVEEVVGSNPVVPTMKNFKSLVGQALFCYLLFHMSGKDLGGCQMIDLTPKYLKPGMVMAQSVYNSCGANYLVKGTKLTEQYVKKLRDLGVEGIHVVSTETDSAVKPSAPVLQEQTRALAVKHVYDVFSMAKQEGNLRDEALWRRQRRPL